MKPIFWISDHRANLWFECSKYFDAVRILSDGKIDNEKAAESAIIQITNNRKDDEVLIYCWYTNSANKNFCMSAVVKYEKNRSYSINFDSSKCIAGAKEFLFVLKPTNDYSEFFNLNKSIKVTAHIPYEKAKKEFNKLVKARLIEKHYDSWLKKVDIACRACQVKGEPAEWLSNPSYGRVLETADSSTTIKFKNFKDSFIFNGRLFKKIKSKDWFTTKYWNKEEYMKVAKYHYDHGLIENEIGEIDKGNLEKWKKDWPPFEETHLYYKDNKTRKVFTEQTELEWEPVTTKGWCTEPYPGSTDCPVCKRTYQITNAYPEWSSKVSTLVGKLKFILRI